MTLFACIFIGTVFCAGILLNFTLHGLYGNLSGWIIGIIFSAALAVLLGRATGTARTFQAVYIAWIYFGPVNQMWKFDFLGIISSNWQMYLLFAVLFTILLVLIEGKSMKELRFGWH